jgi:hypothetical protein
MGLNYVNKSDKKRKNFVGGRIDDEKRRAA